MTDFKLNLVHKILDFMNKIKFKIFNFRLPGKMKILSVNMKLISTSFLLQHFYEIHFFLCLYRLDCKLNLKVFLTFQNLFVSFFYLFVTFHIQDFLNFYIFLDL